MAILVPSERGNLPPFRAPSNAHGCPCVPGPTSCRSSQRVARQSLRAGGGQGLLISRFQVQVLGGAPACITLIGAPSPFFLPCSARPPRSRPAACAPARGTTAPGSRSARLVRAVGDPLRVRRERGGHLVEARGDQRMRLALPFERQQPDVLASLAAQQAEDARKHPTERPPVRVAARDETVP